jgi:hypothetical protein
MIMVYFIKKLDQKLVILTFGQFDYSNLTKNWVAKNKNKNKSSIFKYKNVINK